MFEQWKIRHLFVDNLVKNCTQPLAKIAHIATDRIARQSTCAQNTNQFCKVCHNSRWLLEKATGYKRTTRASPPTQAIASLGRLRSNGPRNGCFGFQFRSGSWPVRLDIDVVMQTVRTAVLQTVIDAAAGSGP